MEQLSRRITVIMIAVFISVCTILLVVVFQTDSNDDFDTHTDVPTATATSVATPTIRPSSPSVFDSVDSLTWSYYQDIALTSEYSSDDQRGLIKKWTDDIRIYINEFASAEDLQVIHNHIAALNNIPGVPTISTTEDRAMCNVVISFVTQSEMNIVTQGRDEIAFGFTRIWWNRDAHITEANIYIVRDKQDVMERQHTILEEMTQALGLMNDSNKYPDSIFYTFYSDAILELSDLDWEIVRIHYSDEVKPGMGREELKALYPIGE